MASEAPATAPWHATFPAPKDVELGAVERDEVLEMIKGVDKGATRDFVLVDVRRNDHEGGTIRRSINLPAQSLYPSMPTVYSIFKAAGIRKVIWYCGSCGGRGPRAAGWFRDYIAEKGDAEMRSVILAGGIKGWVGAGGKFIEFMDGYDGAAWGKQ